MRKGTGVTWRSGVGGDDATDGVVDVPRYLCIGDDGCQHAEGSETGVAAAGDSSPWGACRRGDGGHVVNVRRLRSESNGPRWCRRARHSRGKSLGKDSPVLRICMETTRASLLWQAAAVRPEPEKDAQFEVRGRAAEGRRFGGCRSCFVISNGV